MDFINEQDDVARGLHLAQQALDPLLELAAKLLQDIVFCQRTFELIIRL